MKFKTQRRLHDRQGWLFVKLLSFIFAASLSACAVNPRVVEYDGYRGKIEVDRSFNSYDAARDVASKYCQSQGKLFSYYSTIERVFYCKKIEPYTIKANETNIKNTFDPNSTSQLPSIPEAKAKCAELGFKSGTEAFGNCVLKLSK